MQAVPMIMTFKVLKYFSSSRISFYLLFCGNEISNRKNGCYISETLTHTTVGLLKEKGQKKGCIPRKNIGFLGGISLIWKLMEYVNYHSPDARIIPTSSNKFL